MNENDFQNKLVEKIIKNTELNLIPLENLIIPIGTLTAPEALEVYANDYKYRLLDAIRLKFETIWMVLGDDDFIQIVFEFIKENPSKNFDLNAYGNDFPIFLSQKKELLNEIPFLIDLAHFELAFWNIFHAKNPEHLPFDFYSYEKILNSTLEFSEEIQLLNFDFNIFPLFQFKSETLEKYLEKYSRESIFEKAYYLLLKKDFTVRCIILSYAQFQFFQNFLNKNEKKSLLDVINLTEDITQEEIQDIFKHLSCYMLNNLKEI